MSLQGTDFVRLSGSGVEVPDEWLAHAAPLGCEYVGLTSDYLTLSVRFRPSSHRSSIATAVAPGSVPARRLPPPDTKQG